MLLKESPNFYVIDKQGINIHLQKLRGVIKTSKRTSTQKNSDRYVTLND